jgi:hypothetical protein
MDKAELTVLLIVTMLAIVAMVMVYTNKSITGQAYIAPYGLGYGTGGSKAPITTLRTALAYTPPALQRGRTLACCDMPKLAAIGGCPTDAETFDMACGGKGVDQFNYYKAPPCAAPELACEVPQEVDMYG